jgi:RNA polymerase sigma-70 factor, ECF subfamily
MRVPMVASSGAAETMPSGRRPDMAEHRALLQGIARRLCGDDEAAADDLVHDTYVRALRARDRYDDRGITRTWLIVILHNLFIDHCRKAKRRRETEYIDAHDLAAPEPIGPPTWACVTPEQVGAAIERLSPEIRRVFELHVAGQSYDEIARALRLPKNTVGTRLLRGRKKLKAVLLAELGQG